MIERVPLSAEATSAIGAQVPGLDLDPGERVIALERPSVMKWVIFGMLAITVVLLPVALYFLLARPGKAYVLTNRRVVRVNGPGKLQQIPLADLHGYEFKSDFFMPNTSIVLLPRAGTPHRKVRFAMLTAGFSMSRMWGALNLWALSPWVTPDEAPPVNARGEPIVGPPAVDVVVVDKTFFTAGLTVKPSQGAALVTPSRVVFLQSEGISFTGSKIYPNLPVHAYLAAKAALAPDLTSLEQLIDWVLTQPDLTHHCFTWARCADLAIGRLRQLTFKHDGKRCGLTLSKKSAPAVAEYLRRHGLLGGA